MDRLRARVARHAGKRFGQPLTRRCIAGIGAGAVGREQSIHGHLGCRLTWEWRRWRQAARRIGPLLQQAAAAFVHTALPALGLDGCQPSPSHLGISPVLGAELRVGSQAGGHSSLVACLGGGALAVIAGLVGDNRGGAVGGGEAIGRVHTGGWAARQLRERGVLQGVGVKREVWVRAAPPKGKQAGRAPALALA